MAGLPLALGAGGCTSLLGDFSSGTQGAPDANLGDGHVGSSGASSGSSSGGSSSGSATDASDGAPGTGDDGSSDGASDAPPPPPPPAPGKPGLDLTGGGNVSVSINYKLRIGAVGESPGGNVVAKSTHFTLRGGVVAGTQ